MRKWFRPQADPKELFPIESLPLETFGDDEGDTLHLLYRKNREPQPGEKKVKLRPGMNLDRDKELFFKRILPILDGFDNIFRYAGQSDIQRDETLGNWLKTLETLYRRLLVALEKEGLVAIESVGSLLDLSLHEVIDIRDIPDTPDNQIVEEIVKGYRYGNRVIRDAKVIVAKRSVT